MQHISIKGFTIVELVVVITATAVLAGVLFGPLNDLYGSNTKSTTKIVQIQSIHNTLRSMQALITQSTAFLPSTYTSSTSTSIVPDPSRTNSAAGQWSSTNGGNVLITSNYATTTNTNTTDQTDTVHNNDQTLAKTTAADASCSVPLQNNYVYFLDTTTNILWRRLLTNTSVNCAGAIYQKQSCAPDNTNSYCKSTDVKVATNVSNFSVNFCASATSALSACTADPASAKTVVLSMTITNGVGLNTQSISNSLRVTSIN